MMSYWIIHNNATIIKITNTTVSQIIAQISYLGMRDLQVNTVIIRYQRI